MQETLAAILQFDNVRGWTRYHNPKNLAMALSAEVGEISAELQWVEGTNPATIDVERLARIRLELADVGMYLLRLAFVLDVDLASAIEEKIRINESRFPVGHRHPDEPDA